MSASQSIHCSVGFSVSGCAKTPKRLHKRVVRDVSMVFDAPSKQAAEERLEEFVARWSKELPEAVDCLRNAFEAATRFYAFPQAHWRRIKTTNSLERLHGEIKRRTRAVGAFPDRESAMRLITSVALKTCARWGDRRYLEMDLLQEVKKTAA